MTRSPPGSGGTSPKRIKGPEDPMVTRIRSMAREFHFAVSCLNTVINGGADAGSRNWNSCFNVPAPFGPPLFTDNIRRGIMQLVSQNLSICIHITFHSWFVDNRVTRPLAKALLDMMTASYLLRPFKTLDFLGYCALISELSALCFYAGVDTAPEYGIGCILYTIKKCIDKESIDNSTWFLLDKDVENICMGAEDISVYYEKVKNKRKDNLQHFSSQ